MQESLREQKQRGAWESWRIRTPPRRHAGRELVEHGQEQRESREADEPAQVRGHDRWKHAEIRRKAMPRSVPAAMLVSVS